MLRYTKTIFLHSEVIEEDIIAIFFLSFIKQCQCHAPISVQWPISKYQVLKWYTIDNVSMKLTAGSILSNSKETGTRPN